MLKRAFTPSLHQFFSRHQVSQIRHLSTVSADDADSHDDFKRKFKEPPIANVEATIKKDIESNEVFVYMKGTPETPMCGFSRMACAILNAYGVKYGSRNVLADENIREGIKTYTNWPTIPQVFFKGEFIGGCDILRGLHDNGELMKLVESLNTK